MRILKYLKPYKLALILIALLLLIRVMGTLMLPEYSAKLLDNGIVRHGVEKNILEEISIETKNRMYNMFNNTEKQLFDKYYLLDEKENKYRLVKEKDNNGVYNEKLEELEKVFNENIYTIVNGNTEYSMDKKNEMVEKLNKDPLARKQILKDNNIKIFEYIKEEYKKVGKNIDEKGKKYIIDKSIFMVIIALIIGITSIIVELITSKVAAKIAKNLREKLYAKVLSMSKTNLSEVSVASLITRTTNDVTSVQTTIHMGLFFAIYSIIMSIAGVIKILSLNVKMSGIIFAGVLFMFVSMGIMIKVGMENFKQIQKLKDGLNLKIKEIVTGLHIIRIFGREKTEEKRFGKENEKVYNNNIVITKLMALRTPVITVTLVMSSVLIVLIGANEVELGKMAVGEVVAFMAYASQVIMSFLFLAVVIMILPRALAASARIDEILETKIDITNDEEAIELEKIEEIEFKNVYLKMKNAHDYILKDISFNINKGENIGIIGATGSGKTVILDLLNRYYETTKGNIYITNVKKDGTKEKIDIRKIRLESLREHISVVTQKTKLFKGSIKENIGYGNKEITEEKIKEVSKIAEIYEYIEEKGLDYQIEENASNLSGGQKQRISIARAIAYNSEVLVFDDSFSALDFETDRKIREKINEKLKDQTIITVAQRIATIKEADKIIVIDEGMIESVGKHKELLEKSKIYREIAEIQMSKEEIEKDLENE